MVSNKQLKSYIEHDYGYTVAFNTFKKYNPSKSFIRKKAYEAVKSDYLGKGLTSKQSVELKRSKIKIKNTLPEQSNNKLSPKQRQTRQKALSVLKEARNTADNKPSKENSLSTLAKKYGIKVKDVLLNTRSFTKTTGGVYEPRFEDSIPRKMRLWSKGDEIYVEVNSNFEASRIGQYFSALGQYKRTGDASVLEQFKGEKVTDVNGKTYVFETDTEAIDELFAEIEEIEYFDIYEILD